MLRLNFHIPPLLKGSFFPICFMHTENEIPYALLERFNAFFLKIGLIYKYFSVDTCLTVSTEQKAISLFLMLPKIIEVMFVWIIFSQLSIRS